MNKLFYFIIVLLFIIICFFVFLIIFQQNRHSEEITNFKKLDLVIENQQKIETILFENSLHIITEITKLSRTIEEQSANLNDTQIGMQKLNKFEIDQIKSLIIAYSEEVKNINKIEKVDFTQRKAEADYSVHQLLIEGYIKYKAGDFSDAVKVYKKILEIDPSNTEALCYSNTALYYQNPGDSSNLSEIKNSLVPLLEGKILKENDERTVLRVLIGISMEEGNIVSLNIYKDALQKLEEGE